MPSSLNPQSILPSSWIKTKYRAVRKRGHMDSGVIFQIMVRPRHGREARVRHQCAMSAHRCASSNILCMKKKNLPSRYRSSAGIPANKTLNYVTTPALATSSTKSNSCVCRHRVCHGGEIIPRRGNSVVLYCTGEGPSFTELGCGKRVRQDCRAWFHVNRRVIGLSLQILYLICFSGVKLQAESRRKYHRE